MDNETNANTQNDTNKSANPSSRSQGSSSDWHNTPEDVKDRVKESVQRGVAAVAGALKGFTEEARKHNLADTTKEAIQKMGETTRQVVGTTAREVQQTKDHVKAQMEQAKSTSGSSLPTDASRPTLGAGASRPYPSAPSYDATKSDTTRFSAGTMGGSATPPSTILPESSSRGTSLRDNAIQVPDLRKTELGKDDEDLGE